MESGKSRDFDHLDIHFPRPLQIPISCSCLIVCTMLTVNRLICDRLYTPKTYKAVLASDMGFDSAYRTDDGEPPYTRLELRLIVGATHRTLGFDFLDSFYFGLFVFLIGSITNLKSCPHTTCDCLARLVRSRT